MASTDGRPVAKKNVAYRVTFPIFDADGDLVSGATGLDSEVSKNGGTFTDCTNEATEIATSSGMYYLDLTSTEMNADTVAVIVKSSGKTTPVVMYPEEAGDMRVNVTQWNNSNVATPDTAGFPKVTIKDGTGTGEIALTSGKIDEVSALTGHTAQTGNTFGALPTNFSDLAITVTTGLVNITQAAADKAWSTATRALTDKVGFALSAAGIQAIWDALTSALTTAGSIGKLLVDNINAAITSRSSHAAADVWSVGTRALTDKVNFSLAADQSAVTVGTANALGAQAKLDVNAEVDTALADIDLDHFIQITAGAENPTVGSYLDKIMNKSGSQTFDPTTESLEAIRDRGDAAWITGGGGGITDIINITPLIPQSIDLANATVFRLGIMLINSLDDLPSTAEITPGTISIERKAIGGTSWSAIVTDVAMSEIAGLVYYDEVFDTGTGYAEGDSIRITFKSVKITVAANDYEIVGTTGRMFYTEIRQTAGGGAADWTSGEKNQIRDAMGVDGSKTTAVGGQLQVIDTNVDSVVAKLPSGTISDFDEAANNVTVDTNNDKTGYALSAAGIQAIWDALTSALTTVGSVGKKLADWVLGSDNKVEVSADVHSSGQTITGIAGTKNTLDDLNDLSAAQVNAEVDTALADYAPSTHSAADIWTAATRTLTSFGTLVSDIWNALTSGLTTAGSIGKLLVDNINAAITSRSSHSAAAVWSVGTRTLTAGTKDTEIDAIKLKTDGLPNGVAKNTALNNFEFFMVNSTDHITGEPSLSITAERSIDGGAFAACANSASEVSGGVYKINFAASDLNGDVITFKFSGSGADTRLLTIVTQS